MKKKVTKTKGNVMRYNGKCIKIEKKRWNYIYGKRHKNGKVKDIQDIKE